MAAGGACAAPAARARAALTAAAAVPAPQMGARNLLENTATVQFNHRSMAYLTLGAVGGLVLAARRAGFRDLPRRAQRAVHSLGGMVVVQAGLGISTLMLYVPVSLGAAHQVRARRRAAAVAGAGSCQRRCAPGGRARAVVIQPMAAPRFEAERVADACCRAEGQVDSPRRWGPRNACASGIGVGTARTGHSRLTVLSRARPGSCSMRAFSSQRTP